MLSLRKRRQTTPQTRTNLPQEPVEYPIGICVKTENGAYRITGDGKRYKIPTQAILDSWAFPLIVDTSEAAVAKYPVAITKLGFRDGSLLINIADAKMYLVSDGVLRHIVNPAVLDRLWVTKDDFAVVSQSEIKMMKQGEVMY